MIFERHANLKYKYGNRHFWCRGYYVDTVGKNAKKIEDIDWELVQRLCDKGAQITSRTLEKMLEYDNYGSINLPRVVRYLTENDEEINVDDIYIKAVLSDSQAVRGMAEDEKDENKVKTLGYLASAFCDNETLGFLLDKYKDVEWSETKE